MISIEEYKVENETDFIENVFHPYLSSLFTDLVLRAFASDQEFLGKA